MRQAVCDNSTCNLEPPSDQGIITNKTMTGGNVGISPEESTYYIPLKSKVAGTKRTRRSQTGGGRRRRCVSPLQKVKKAPSRKRKRHSSTKVSRKRTTRGPARRKVAKRKCVRRKK